MSYDESQSNIVKMKSPFIQWLIYQLDDNMSDEDIFKTLSKKIVFYIDILEKMRKDELFNKIKQYVETEDIYDLEISRTDKMKTVLQKYKYVLLFMATKREQKENDDRI